MPEDVETAETAEAGARPAARPGGRNARVRSQILAATTELVARNGVAGLRYEEIAELAGVNKNSVYRNWPDRARLVSDALLQYAEDSAPLHDSGDLRRDLVDFLMVFSERLSSSVGRALLQAAVTAPGNTDLDEAVRTAYDRRFATVRKRFDSAVDKGEIPPVDSYFLTELLSGPVYLYVTRRRRPFTREVAEKIVDVVLAGIRATAP
ncbi:TetR/AcrR family transcriptional regulator [Saccharothrix coeruleofusca]|uniref:HTH-type transcriptional regulator n=1 Tax=Saccharothrix coeruleofusca TaxID=33919 RepID=A0A918EI33_9PSEU|nr:TetR/AcrR family transcriptional regulator [Saccharothrix coeruleofusca]MBP2337342.1 AcrR family transcriptional regulator [Saccharothrix coeruleofusca]GGP81387.1 putative HTH-type transcriptional regulator [Saccharothrix coeruleofusca]